MATFGEWETIKKFWRRRVGRVIFLCDLRQAIIQMVIQSSSPFWLPRGTRIWCTTSNSTWSKIVRRWVDWDLVARVYCDWIRNKSWYCLVGGKETSMSIRSFSLKTSNPLVGKDQVENYFFKSDGGFLAHHTC
jgi:hypothetical protein